MLDFDDIKQAIIASLTPDLLSKEWRLRVSPDEPRESGHCAVATEAFYYLIGGKVAGFKPVVCGYWESPQGAVCFEDQGVPPGSLRSTHWWVQGPYGPYYGAGAVYDVTAGQYGDYAFPYERGRGAGFQNPKKIPSRRAQIVMDRVTELLGEKELAAFRAAQVRKYQMACHKFAIQAYKI